MNSALTYAADTPPMRRTRAAKEIWALGIAALLTAASANAFAADVPVRGPLPARGPAAAPTYAPPYVQPTPYPFYNWTGFYIGGNLGGAWESGSLTDNRFGVDFSNSRSGFVGGVQVGYNWQLSPEFVVGVEWMFDGTNIKSDAETVTVSANTVVSASTSVDFITTLAARFGWALNNWLFYGKVGGALVHDSATVTVETGGAFFSASASDTRGGWLVGAGIEYGFAPRWTARLEWDHIGLGDDTQQGIPADSITLSRRFDLLTVGLNYRF